MTLNLSIYTIICSQTLNFLISSGETIDNHFVQFFANQAQVGTIDIIAYLIGRVSVTIKSIKACWSDAIDKA